MPSTPPLISVGQMPAEPPELFCPQCQQAQPTLPIRYGLLKSRYDLQSDPGEALGFGERSRRQGFVMGGCMIEEPSAKWVCRECLAHVPSVDDAVSYDDWTGTSAQGPAAEFSMLRMFLRILFPVFR